MKPDEFAAQVGEAGKRLAGRHGKFADLPPGALLLAAMNDLEMAIKFGHSVDRLLEIYCLIDMARGRLIAEERGET